MSGFICKTEVVKNAVFIIRKWGIKVFIQCIVAKNGTPFLTILIKMGKI